MRKSPNLSYQDSGLIILHYLYVYVLVYIIYIIGRLINARLSLDWNRDSPTFPFLNLLLGRFLFFSKVLSDI